MQIGIEVPLPSTPMSSQQRHVALSDEAQLALIDAARDARAVEGFTHRYYRYPARFSPVFVGEAIRAFTGPGDLICDPHVGGGTTLVEAIAAGRRALGIDISTLATFVSRAKTIRPDIERLQTLPRLTAKLAGAISMHRAQPPLAFWRDAGYLRNLDSRSRWRLRKAIAQAVAWIEELGDAELELLLRCIVLRTAQWALDGRKRLPTIGAFRSALLDSARVVVDGAIALATAAPCAAAPTILTRSVIGIEEDVRVLAVGAPRLILTSPPYPGVHVLYHRWQVDGRKESAAPFAIANALDGSGESFYTMGGRKRPGLTTYFEQLGAGLASLRAISSSETVLVQVVGFSQPAW